MTRKNKEMTLTEKLAQTIVEEYHPTSFKMRLTKSPFENLVFGLSAPEIQYSTEVMLCL